MVREFFPVRMCRTTRGITERFDRGQESVEENEDDEQDPSFLLLSLPFFALLRFLLRLYLSLSFSFFRSVGFPLYRYLLEVILCRRF